jgi:Asp-tRNA(Asn)/Glu-tRNA(Gln) amidotransferase A subunit family amidase
MKNSELRAADQARAAGKPLPPLHGVPITIKDNIDTAALLERMTHFDSSPPLLRTAEAITP